MKDLVEQFYKDIKRSREACPWAKGQSLENFFGELKKEIDEAQLAIDKNDMANLKEELGDIFWDALFMMVIAEDEKGFDIKEMIENAHKKLLRRKPHVFGSAKAETKEEAVRLWDEAKKREKRNE